MDIQPSQKNEIPQTPLPQASGTNPIPPQQMPTAAQSPALQPSNTPTPPKAPATPRKPLPWGTIIIVVVVIILIGLGWYSFGTVNINPSPGYDSITINGKSINAGSLKHLPGTLDVKIEKEGYLTYEKKVRLNMHGTADINPELKELPTAQVINESATGPLVAAAAIGGAKAVNENGDYLIWARPSTNTSSGFETVNLNLEALSGIETVQYPTNQEFALISRTDEVGIQDFDTPDATSQSYETFGTNIRSIALSNDGEEVFYWQYDPDQKKSYLVRDTILKNKTDRYFDQPLIDQLGLTDPILRWSDDNEFVLAIEGNVAIIDIINRQAKIIAYDEGVVNAWLTPNNLVLVAVTETGELVTIDLSSSGNTSESASTTTAEGTPFSVDPLGIFTTGENVIVKDDSNIFLLAETEDENGNNINKLIDYNFDEKTEIGYLLDDTLVTADIETIAVDFNSETVYFLVGNKVYMQALVSNDYE